MREENLILLVEDNPDDELLTLRAFEKSNLGNRVVVVHDGEGALDFLFYRGKFADRDREPPVLVILDLKLPKLDGLEVLREIRNHSETRLLPVVVLTTSDQERDVVQSYRLGANSFVKKPVDFHEFVEAVRQLGLYWLVINRPPRQGGK